MVRGHFCDSLALTKNLNADGSLTGDLLLAFGETF